MQIKARELWRVERIEKVIGIVADVLDMDEEQLKSLIHDIDDFQGNLQVFWHHPMTRTQARAFETAWKLCGEKPENISHHVFW